MVRSLQVILKFLCKLRFTRRIIHYFLRRWALLLALLGRKLGVWHPWNDGKGDTVTRRKTARAGRSPGTQFESREMALTAASYVPASTTCRARALLGGHNRRTHHRTPLALLPRISQQNLITGAVPIRRLVMEQVHMKPDSHLNFCELPMAISDTDCMRRHQVSVYRGHLPREMILLCFPRSPLRMFHQARQVTLDVVEGSL